ncbi:MAG: adenylate/guanylate cyclase domain-containing protein [Pseudomonadota bacterium]
MKEAHPDQIIRRIQEAIAAETGVRIGSEAALRLHAALSPDSASRYTTPGDEDSSREVTVLMTDLRGFTSISETNSARTVLEVLNRYLSRMCEVAVHNGGTIDKFMGDAVMVVFGAPQRGADDARRAVTCAVQMQIAMVELNRDQESKGFPPLFMGAGINTGHVMAGLLGSELHSEYTVIGDEVNLASRIETFSLRGQVLISESTFDRCRDFVAAGTPMDVHVKGKSKPVCLREVFAIPPLGLQVPQQEVRNSPRVEVRIPFTYQAVVDKIVMPPKRTGVVHDLGYHGIFAAVEPGLMQHGDILLELDLSLIGSRVDNIYAKVRSTTTDRGRNFASIEFTSLSQLGAEDIRHFVQMLIQGSPTK